MEKFPLAGRTRQMSTPPTPGLVAPPPLRDGTSSNSPGNRGSFRHRLLEFTWHARAFLLVVFGVSTSVAYIVETEWASSPELVVEMRSDTTSTAQVFYDTGAGMSEAESGRAPVSASTTYSMVRFPLPDRPLRGLRFDPIAGAGTFSVRRVYVTDPFGGIVRQFRPKDLLAINQIASRQDTALESLFATIPGANDPMLQLAFTGPLSPSAGRPSNIAQVLGGLVLALLFTSVAGGIYFVVGRYLSWPRRQLDRIAAAVSDPAFLVFDRLAIAWYLGIAAIFIAAVSAGLHGSSLSLFSSMGPVDGSVQPILGWPKPIRSDEWAYHTPAILHQVYRDQPFSTDRVALGAGGAALISNVPIRHVTTLFRPQFWAFFVLPASYGFAFYWQFKAVLLLTGVFTLLLLLTRSSKLAAVGALWYGWSPWVQWGYSWPSALPELIGLFCLVMCATFYLSVGRRPDLLLAAVYICVSCAVNFALCAYVPHLISLVWFGLFLCGWWTWVRWKDIVTGDYLAPRVAAFCGAWLTVAVVMLVTYHDAEPALTTLANTSYPGRRSSPGGLYAMSMLFSHYFSFWADDVRFPLPQVFTNVCEWAGFFWLAPVTLFCVRAIGDDTYKRRAYLTLLIFGALLFAWLTLPVPASVGRMLFLDKTGSHRSQHVMGLVNVGLVMLFMSLSRTSGDHARDLRQSLVLGVAVFAVIFPVFQVVNTALANFLTLGQVAVAASYISILIVAIAENRLSLFAVFLLVPQFAVFGVVNPIGRGLRVVESSPLFEFVHTHPELLRDRWIVYSGAVPHSGFFNAVGCEVVTGLDYVPDLRSLSMFDPTGAQREIINRSVYFLAEPKYDEGPAKFELPEFNMVLWRVSPLDPGLRHIGVRYAAFVQPPPPHIAARMKPLSTEPISGFWLYELPDSPQ